jgi:LysR family transcriptional regulator, flagellar master operon regulator
MNIALVRTFLEVIDTKNMKSAAERLHVTQSAVTVRINTLERLLGQQLFIRSKAGVELTYAGFMFERYAEMFLQVWQQAQQAISLPKGFACTLNIGFEFDLWNELMYPWATAMRTGIPDAVLGLWPGDSAALTRWLSSGLVELGLTYGVPVRSGIEISPLFDDSLVLVSTTPRKISGDGTAMLEPDYMYIDRGDDFRQQHARAFPTTQTVPTITFGGEHVALEYLLNSGGYAYISYRAASPYLRSGRLSPVSGAPELHKQVYLATGISAAQCPAVPQARSLLQRIATKQMHRSSESAAVGPATGATRKRSRRRRS